ncbi:MAG: NADPH dehydrogenase NamA, partial [Bacillaceae bacterium]
MAKLFQEIEINGLKLKNRIVMAPMVMNSSDNLGLANNFHLVHYTTRAVGGVGAIIIEATAVEPRGRITNEDLGIWSDEHIEPLSRIVSECKKYGAKIGIQLAHAGRKCQVLDEQSIAPSAIAFDQSYRMPNAMTREDIQVVIEAFKQGARRAKEAGFDFVEIHGAHGYLINEFMSPLTNTRADEYKNRATFLGEIVKSVRSVFEKPISLRVSGYEYREGGNTPTEVGNIINEVKQFGIDMVHVSSGGVVPAPIDPYPGYQIPFAEKIKEVTGLPVIGGGLITEPAMAEEIVESGSCDMVFFARELLRNPYWPLHAAKVLEADIEWPKQYIRAK